MSTVDDLRGLILAGRYASGERLREVAVTLGEHARRHDLDAVYRLNAEFHQTLVRLGGSAVLAQSISSLVHSPVLLRTYSAFDEEAMRRSVDHHIEIAAAVRAGDPDWRSEE